jgi:hypothetical protein
MRTSAVLRTREGNDILAAGKQKDLTPAQQALAAEGDILAKLPGEDAEITALDAAMKAGLTPQQMAVSRQICPDCVKAIEASGGRITLGGFGAEWER